MCGLCGVDFDADIQLRMKDFVLLLQDRRRANYTPSLTPNTYFLDKFCDNFSNFYIFLCVSIYMMF